MNFAKLLKTPFHIEYLVAASLLSKILVTEAFFEKGL